MICPVCTRAFPNTHWVPDHIVDGSSILCLGSGKVGSYCAPPPPWIEPNKEKPVAKAAILPGIPVPDEPAPVVEDAPKKERKKAKRTLKPEIRAMHIIERTTAGLPPAAIMRVAQWFIGLAQEAQAPVDLARDMNGLPFPK